MILYIKNKYVCVATALVVFTVIALTSAAAFAGSEDLTPSTASTYTDVPKEAPAGDVGTAVGAPDVSENISATDSHADSATPVSAKKRTFGETAAKVLDAISKHPTAREVKVPDWRIIQDKAVVAAREGHYDQALASLSRLREAHPENLGIACDYAAILGWAGRDADAVATYKALPAGDRPDYLTDSIGHAFRNLHQPEEALKVYRAGLETYPSNQSFVAGEILSLVESGKNAEARDLAHDALRQFPSPSDDLIVAIKTSLREDAVALARAGHYKEALAAFAALHDKYPQDSAITADYVAVLSWAGHDTEAVAMYRTLPAGDQPDYILDAAAHSYRNLRQPQAALDLYQAALAKSPDNIVYAVGAIYCLSDLGRDKEALQLAQSQLAKHPEHPEALVKAYSMIQRRHAIDLARAGHYEEALKLLRQLRAEYPSDITEVMDYIAVSSWAGHDSDAVKEYVKHIKQPMPDYVLEAVGGSYRKLQEYGKALAVYRRGLKQSPRNEVFAAGEVRTLDDLGRYEEAQARAKKFTDMYGDHLDVLLAGGEAANFNDQPIEALNFYEHAQAMAAKNHEAVRGLIHAEDRLGAAPLALKLAAKHPGVMKGDEYRAIVGDADQSLVRWAVLEPANEASRYAETDKALAILDAHIGAWTALNDPAAYPNIQRARFDRLIALRDRQRMQDVVDSYNALVQDGVEVPAYALEPVGEAYLALREPEIARDVFLKALQTDPSNFQVRRLLAYAYLECDQYDEALATIDKVRADEPTWIYLKGEPDRQPNPSRAMAELDAGEIRSYSGLLQEADEHITPLVEAGAYDARNRVAAGNVFLARGLPRRAMEQFQIALAIQDGHDVAAETGLASANLELQNFAQAEAQAQGLAKRFPENQGVKRLNREVEIYNMAELDAHAGYSFAPSESSTATNSPHGQGFDVGAELYSSPIDHNWRLFAGEDFAHEHEPNGEGIIDYSRANAGVEYRKSDVTASIAPTFNTYDSRERVGVDGKAKYSFNDQWSADIGAELFSQQTPLRALNAGVTADRYDAGVLWRQNESREVSFDAYVMPFSDGNTRTGQTVEYIERVYTAPTFKVDGEANLGASQNSQNETRLYYNPSLDFLGLVGARATQTLYHRYETLYEHNLLVMPGLYSQQGYGTSAAWLVRYEHRLHYNDTLNAGVGVNYTHQDYDGAAQDAVSLTADVVERF